MNSERTNYKQILKATSIFGGVQFFQIIIQIIRSKFIALLLGPSGMGIAGLLNASLALIRGLTGFGLGTSAVKDIAAANATGDETRIATIVTVFRRLVWLTGLLGMFIVLILSPLLSQLTFGNRNFTFAFIWVSVTLLFNQISSGQLVILQGMRKLQYLAKANLYGSIIGLIITIPLYYILGLDGIVPAIIITAIISTSLSFYFAKKISIKHVNVSRVRTIAEGKGMLTLGFMISISGLITLGASYIVRIFISQQGGVEQVGLYNAGFAIINTYVGLVFTAMATDYYPRLSSVAKSNESCRLAINQQAEVAILILSPILSIFIVFINWVIIILYSSKFIEVNQMLYWAALGIFFKTATWSMGFILLAKGKSSLFFWNELIVNIYMLGLNLLGYYYMGLTGLGISFMFSYILYLVQIYIIINRKFGFFYNFLFIKMFTFQFILAICSFMAVKFLKAPYSYLIGIIIIFISTIHAYKELDKRIDLKTLFFTLKDKLKK